MADPGYSVEGGANPTGSSPDVQRGHFSAKTYAKTKQENWVPLGGGLDPPLVVL